MNTARTGYPPARPDSTNNPGYHRSNNPLPNPVPGFEANTPKRYDFELSGANNTVTITGTVTDSDTGAGIKGVEIKVNGSAPLNAGSGQGSGSSQRRMTAPTRRLSKPSHPIPPQSSR